MLLRRCLFSLRHFSFRFSLTPPRYDIIDYYAMLPLRFHALSSPLLPFFAALRLYYASLFCAAVLRHYAHARHNTSYVRRLRD